MASVKYEQPNCGLDAVVVVWANDTLFLLCDDHENEIARMEGEDELDEFRLEEDNFLPKLIKFINERFQYEDSRYVRLLKQYTDMKKAEAADLVGHES